VIDINLYEEIRRLYAVENLSQRAIARKLGISRNTVKRYCKGENVPWETKPRQYEL
jgi:transcriptional regulator with XRE-family HTH domain